MHYHTRALFPQNAELQVDELLLKVNHIDLAREEKSQLNNFVKRWELEKNKGR